tara:strand:- start:852 stop:1055 length:204 start_codon:yes stop_codon:yes gene_type:complete
MALEDRNPFDKIHFQFNFKEKEVIKLMRSNPRESSFRMWKKESQEEKRSIVSLSTRKGSSHQTKSEN